MNIVVLIKQVPDTETLIDITGDGKTIAVEDVKWTVNPYDEFCLEEALRIKESREGVKVTVLTVGPDRVSEAIRTAYAMGVDEAIHINDEIDEEVYGAADAVTTARILATALRTIPYDLIIAGQRAVDFDNYHVPLLVAESLGIPMIGMVTRQELGEGTIRCVQSVDGGTLVVEADLPAMFTTQKGINEPRYPSFRAIMQAKKRPVDERSIEDLGLAEDAVGAAAARVKIRRLSYPPARDGVQLIPGATAQEQAAELVRRLREEAQAL